MTETASLVARYYDRVQWLYNLGWSAGGTRSLHYGLWRDGIRSLAEAIVAADRFVAEKLAVEAEDHVLDMGCGVGGTTVFLAKTFGCRATGITVSRVQLEHARAHAAAHGVGRLVRFELLDYTATGFPAGTFTKAFTLESANYAADKQVLLGEAFRVLAPGGRYVSLDAFQRRDARPGGEAARLGRVLRGWASGGLERFERYVELASAAGFAVEERGEVTPLVQRSARTIRRRHLPLYPLALLARLVRLAPAELVWHFQASQEQQAMYCAADPLLMFGWLAATKPRREDSAASAGAESLR